MIQIKEDIINGHRSTVYDNELGITGSARTLEGAIEQFSIARVEQSVAKIHKNLPDLIGRTERLFAEEKEKLFPVDEGHIEALNLLDDIHKTLKALQSAE